MSMSLRSGKTALLRAGGIRARRGRAESWSGRSDVHLFATHTRFHTNVGTGRRFRRRRPENQGALVRFGTHDADVSRPEARGIAGIRLSAVADFLALAQIFEINADDR